MTLRTLMRPKDRNGASRQAALQPTCRCGMATATAQISGKILRQTECCLIKILSSPAETPQARFASRLNSIQEQALQCLLLSAGIFRSRSSLLELAGGEG